MSTKTERRTRRLSRTILALVVGFFTALAPAAIGVAAAAAAPDAGESVYIGSKQGYGGTGLFPIWYETPTTGEPDAWAFCIEHDVSARTGVEGTVADPEDFLGDNYFAENQSEIFWVLGHGYPALSLEEFGEAAGVPGISRNDAIEAMQYAIWRFTDLSWDASWSWETPNSEAAYWYLVNGANASDGSGPTAAITAPTDPQTAGSLIGPFVVSTNEARVSVSIDPAFDLVDAGGDPVNPNAIVDGQELYLDLRDSTAAGSATITVTAKGSSGTGTIISVPTAGGGEPTEADHAQSIIIVGSSAATVSNSALVTWSGDQLEPLIGTSLVDSADGDRVLAWDGGIVVDTVAYENLTPGTEYTVTGELMDKADGSGTGITASRTFTPTEANGSVEVEFTVPEGYAGKTLVAFERLYVGTDTTGDPVAVHEDIDDAAQTVTVEDEPGAGAGAGGDADGTDADGDAAGTDAADGEAHAANTKQQPLASTGGAGMTLLGFSALLALIAGGAALALKGRSRLGSE